MQHDGNFVIYHGEHHTSEHAIWASNTSEKGHAPRRLTMQEDGNLVLYDAHNHPHWSSNTYNQGHKGHKAKMQDDGNFVVYDGHK